MDAINRNITYQEEKELREYLEKEGCMDMLRKTVTEYTPYREHDEGYLKRARTCMVLQKVITGLHFD